MKLSEISGERTLDVIADLIEPVCNIAGDKTTKSLFKRQKVSKGTDAEAVTLDRLKKNAPKLVKTHKRDIVDILSTIDGVTAVEYEKSLTPVKLVKDFIDLVTDSAFIELFFSAQSGDSSGSAPENTEDQSE